MNGNRDLPTMPTPGRSRPATTALAAPVTVALLLALLPAAAAGTPARQAALGGGDGLEDASAIFRWPGSARDHVGRLWFDSGVVDPRDGWTTGDDQPRTGPAIALAWNGGRGWTAGFAAHVRAADADHVGLHRDGPGTSYSWLLARAIGPVDVGATWRSVWGGWNADADTPDEFEHRRDDLGLGARLDLSPRAYLDVAGDIRRQANRLQGRGDPPDWDLGESASSRSWSARARLFVELHTRSVLTLAAERLREDFTGPVAGGDWLPDVALDQDNRLARIEATICLLPDPDRLLAASVLYAQARATRVAAAGDGDADTAGSGKVRVLGLRLAAEQRLNWWLSLRASAGITDLARYSLDDDDDAGRIGDTPLDVAAGVGLHLGAWGADLAAGNTPLPAPWRWLAPGADHDAWLRATLHHDF